MNAAQTTNIDATVAIIDLITGSWRAQALYTAVKLKLPDLIDEGQTSSLQLAQSTGAKEDGIHRLLRLLVSLGVFQGNERDGYQNTVMSATLIDGPDSLRDMCLLYGEECYTAWEHAYDAIRTTSSGFEQAFGQSFYDYLGANKEVAKRFQNTMNTASMFFHEVTTIFDFSGGKTIVDVGGGGGELLATILTTTPDANGILFDCKHMIPKASEHFAETIGLNRVRLISGDMFETIPEGGDVYLLSRVLAGWDDSAIINVLNNCREGMINASSSLLIFDRLIEDDGSSTLAALWDLQLLMTIGGRHRTLGSFISLLNQAEFKVERIVKLPMETTAIIATPMHPNINQDIK